MSVYPSIGLSVWKNSSANGYIFINVDIWVFLENLSRKYKFHYNMIKITCTLHGDQYKFWPYLAHFFSEGGMFQWSVVKKIKIYILCLIFFKNRAFCEIKGEKHCRAGQTTDDNMAHVRCMLDTKVYKTHIQNLSCLQLFHGNNVCTNDPQYYVIRALSLLFTFL